MSSSSSTWKRLLKRSLWGIGPLLVILVIMACQPVQPAPAAASKPKSTPTAVASSASVTTTTATKATAAMQGDAKAGAYIAAITGGCGCHMNRELGGLAGGNTFTVTDGLVYAANITPDKETGIGKWTAEQVAAAITTGVSQRGGKAIQLHPVMPYRGFSNLSQQEALDVGAYLLSLKPLANQVKARTLKAEPAPFAATQPSPATAPTEPVARGHQLVSVLGCGGCHTPKNQDGTPKADMMLAGAPLRGTEVAWNLTPDAKTGIGDWTVAQIATGLRTGKLPDGKQIQGAMAQQIERRFGKLTEADATAIATFLKSIPAVNHDPSAK